MVDSHSRRGSTDRGKGKQTKDAREIKYHTHDDGGDGAGVREPRRPTPVVGPQQAENPEEIAEVDLSH